MALAVLAANLGVLWVAIEATTVVTAFLVGQRRDRGGGRGGLEVRGDLLDRDRARPARHLPAELRRPARRAPRRAGLGRPGAATPRSWTPAVTRIAVVLLILGFGTKAGLAPAARLAARRAQPGPGAGVRADVRGADLGRRSTPILRVKVIADAALGPDFARSLLLVVLRWPRWPWPRP